MSDLNIALNEHFKSGRTQKQVDAIVREILFNQPRIKIVISTCVGKFSLSTFARESLGLSIDDVYEIPRDDARLVALIEKEGSKKVSGWDGTLKIVDAPAGSNWVIDDDSNGVESLT